MFLIISTNYYLPKPAACFNWIYPIGLDLIESNDIVNNPIIVVKSTRIYGAQNIPSKDIKSGDLILKINGLSPVELYQSYAGVAGGCFAFTFFLIFYEIQEQIFMVVCEP